MQVIWQQDVADLVDDCFACQDVGGGDAHVVDPVHVAASFTASQQHMVYA